MDVDIEYTFDLEPITEENYKFSKRIVEWLKENMESIKDAHDKPLFSKVNYGYNQETLKGFGKPVCDVYINHTEYESDLQRNVPDSVTSFIICYMKGNMNDAYLKACELNDYLTQEFNTNPDFRRLTLTETVDDKPVVRNIVSETFIRDNEIQINPSGKVYGILVAFELEHELIR